MKSWQTTVSGVLMSLGIALANMDDPAWMSGLGQILQGLSAFTLGMFARDNNKSSESVRAR